MKKRPAADMYERCPLMPFACPMCDACGMFRGGGFKESLLKNADADDEGERGDAV